MLTKLTIALCTSLVLASALVSPAAAQASNKGKAATSQSSFEKIWFAIPQGSD